LLWVIDQFKTMRSMKDVAHFVRVVLIHLTAIRLNIQFLRHILFGLILLYSFALFMVG